MSAFQSKPKACSFCSLLCELDSPQQDSFERELSCSKRKRMLQDLESQGCIGKSTAGEATAQAIADSAMLDRANAGISRAASILVTGRIHTVESARIAVDLARRLDAIVDPWESDVAFAGIRSLQRNGGFRTSLAECRELADLFLVFGDDSLLDEYPRLPVSLSGKSSLNKSGTPLLLIGNWSEEAADRWREAGFEVLAISADLDQFPRWLSLATRLSDTDTSTSQVSRWLLESQYTTLVWAPGNIPVEQIDLWMDSMMDWVMRQNETRRTTALVWSDPQATFHQVCTWLTGFPGRIVFRGGVASYDPDLFRAQSWFENQRACRETQDRSLILWIDDSWEALPTDITQTKVPTWVLGGKALDTPSVVLNQLASGIAGVTHPGSFFRGDQVVLARVQQLVSFREGNPQGIVRSGMAELARRLVRR